MLKLLYEDELFYEYFLLWGSKPEKPIPMTLSGFIGFCRKIYNDPKYTIIKRIKHKL